ncbi:2-dehydro-3-deoxygalactonokinase [Sphingomonas sp. HMP6]|uniref:2-dehydro-3-deoxygalactonokinase n=1 Tax=Sphingomonas sp. HMP6 TaxID=1517551 RepID=UPI0015967917|nr:2-dehydro-3-deoxygalactonokinase [Sphingomonas sp. HMP6]BCA58292.1 hypothetical protein HMP06_1061 [Sphingomonas sp. HMP6]
MNRESFIAVEWGTAKIRARLLTATGDIVDQVIEEVRLVDLDRAAQVARVAHLRQRWPSASETLWLAGMVGSPIGLESVPHLPCPATPAQLARHARQTMIAGTPLRILPGLSCTSRFGDYDVMRGEEVAAAGLIGHCDLVDAVLLSVPGMHGKWIEMGRARIERFHTSMTAELHALIAERSILAPLTQAAPHDGDAFRAGLTLAADGGSPARLLFSARSRVLAQHLTEEDAASFIWGVLIGSDVRENLPGPGDAARQYFVTGGGHAAPLFRAALAHLGAKVEVIDNDHLTAHGFATIRQFSAEGNTFDD